MVPRFTEFYIPVLQILSDVEKREVNALIDAVADYVGISAEDRLITTKGGQQPRYRSNIQWAITDLCQAGFIDRTERAHYLVNIDGLAMLDENPEHPNREYLAKRSDRFAAFMEKKGTRPRKNNDGSLFDDEEDEAPSMDAIPIVDNSVEVTDVLQELYDLKKRLDTLGLSTAEVEHRIKAVESKLINEAILAPITNHLIPALSKAGRTVTLTIDFAPGKDVSVHISSKQALTESETFTIAESKDEPQVCSTSSIGQKRIRTENKTLIVTMPDGKVLKDASATDILQYVIQYVGPEKVSELGLKSSGMPLVGRQKPHKYSYRELNGGYYLTTNNPTFSKKIFIDKIAEAYNLNIKAEVVV